jgi:hypothetical protein
MSKAASKARVFVPLTKVDEEKRLVYGIITQEVLDKSGEVMDYEKSKPHFEKWSKDIHNATGGLSKGNLRVMHGLNVAGKLTELEFNDNDKSIEVCAKVVDEAQWEMVVEGCYTGFSVGGSYGKRWNEVIDGNTIRKYEAKPNEVSLVDNPCLHTATFSLVKADGATEEVMFKVADTKPGEDAPGTGDKPAETEKPSSEPEVENPAPVQKAVIPNDVIAAKATELAKAAGDDAKWIDFVDAAREELTKAAGEEEEDDGSEEGSESGEEKPAGEGADAPPAVEEPAADPDTDAVEKVTPAGVKQVWQASDGKTFDKKDDCVAHDDALTKAAPVELTEAEQLRARLEKAVSGNEPVVEEVGLLEDFDRLGKALNALSTPFDEAGQPQLEKGMYTINRFSSVLSDMASLSRSIKAEGKQEGDDASDSAVSADIIGAVKTLGASFLSYATNQVTELLAGMDDDVVVSYHDYYYNAVQTDPENGLAKDVVSLIKDHRDPAGVRREELVKSFGFVAGEELSTSDELSPPMQKRFDELKAENEDLKKVAGEAVEKVEELAKRVKTIEDTPLPRAPTGGFVPKEGDGTFLGKKADTDEEKMDILRDMLAKHGPDGMATLMIKASQQSGGHKLSLAQR